MLHVGDVRTEWLFYKEWFMHYVIKEDESRFYITLSEVGRKIFTTSKSFSKWPERDLIINNCHCSICDKKTNNKLERCTCNYTYTHEKAILGEFYFDKTLIKKNLNELKSFFYPLLKLSFKKRMNKERYEKSLAAGIKFNKDLRLKLWTLQDGQCYYCRCSLAKPPARPTLHIDHIMGRKTIEDYGFDNLAATCPKCNLEKCSKTPKKFLKDKSKKLGKSWLEEQLEWMKQVDKRRHEIANAYKGV